MPRAIKVLKWLGLGLGGLLGVVAAGLVAGYVWLRSDAGADWLARQIEQAASTPGEMQLAIGSLQGDLPANLRLRDIALSDPDGDWLTLADLEIDWRPWSLLDRTLDVTSVRISQVALTRLPAGEQPPDAEAGGGLGDLPQFPLKVRLGSVAADEVALGEAVLGQAARFTFAGEARRRDDGSLAARFDLVRLDGIEGRLLAALAYEPRSDNLTADIEASSAAGGLLATILEMPDLPGGELRLKGGGPLADWSGDFALSLGTLAQAEAAIGLARGTGGDLGFRLEGQATITPPGDDPVWRLVRGRTEIAVEGDWQQVGRLRLERLSAAGESLTLDSRGTFEPESGALDVTLSAAASATAGLAELAELDRLDRVAAEVAVSGTLQRPAAQIDLHADGIAEPDFEAAAVSVAGRVTAASDLLGPAPLLQLDLTGRVDAPRLVGQDEVNAVLAAELPLTLRGALDLDSLVLDIAALEISQNNASLSASGPFNLEVGTAQLQAALAVTDLAALQPLTDIALRGQGRLAGPLELMQFGSRLDAELQGRWEQPSSDVGLIGAAAGDGMDVSLRFALDGATVRISDVKARSKVAELGGDLTVSPSPTALDGRYSLTLPNAAALAGELGADFSGPAKVAGNIVGPVDALELSGRLQAQQVAIEDQVLRDLDGTYRLSLRGADIDGPVTLVLSSPYGPVDARSDLKVRTEAVSLTALQAELPEATVKGEVIVPLDDKAPIAELSGDVADLAPWLEKVGLAGGGRGTLAFKLNVPDAAAPVLIDAAFSAVTLVPEPGAAPVSAAHLTLDLQAQDLALEQPGKFSLRGESLSRDELKLDRVDLNGSGTRANVELTLSAAGTLVEPLEVTAAAGVTRSDELLTITLREAEGRAFGQPLLLRSAAQLTLAPDESRLQNLDLASGDTRLTADVWLAEDRITVTAALDALPMTTVDAFWQSGLSGMVSARLDLDGSREDPSGTGSLTATGLRPRDAKDLPELELTSSAEWRSGRVRLQGQLGGAEVTAARFALEGPLQIAADGSGLQIADEGALSGEVAWTGNMNTLLLFVPLPQHRFSGQAAVALDIAGTAGKPQLNGRVSLSEARYENLDTGTILRNLNMTAEVEDDRVTLASLTANDGAKGKVTGDGRLLLDPERDFPFEAAIALENFYALRRDDVTAVASGTVKLEGSAEAPRVEGRFTTDTVEVSLLTVLPPDVVKLDVIEIKDGVVQEPRQEVERAPAVDADLDIIIEMPRRVFVRGRGLDSEWAGRISVQGTTSEPAVSGKVNVVRGRLSVVGKPFNLKEGNVSVPTGADTEPMLDVTAVHAGKGLEVTARLSGPLTQPELELTSRPELPRDEIISRVLFGKTASELSAAEAAQLALAVQDLTGGSGTDILGLARRAVGVDVLRVQSSEAGDAEVQAGKYLTDEVYVGVKQGASTQSSGAEVEVELTPNITVESEVTGSGATKSGVRFKLDY